MKNLLSNFKYEQRNINVDECGLEKYSMLIKYKQYIKIRFNHSSNDNELLSLNIKELYNICNMMNNEIQVEELVLFLYIKQKPFNIVSDYLENVHNKNETSVNQSINHSEHKSLLSLSSSRNERDNILTILSSDSNINESIIPIESKNERFLLSNDNNTIKRVIYFLWKYLYIYLLCFIVFLIIHLISFMCSKFYVMNYFIISSLLMLTCVCLIEWLFIFNREIYFTKKHIIYIIYCVVLIIMILHFIMMNLKLICRENFYLFVHNHLILVDLIYVVFMVLFVFVILNFNEINRISYMKINDIELSQLKYQ